MSELLAGVPAVVVTRGERVESVHDIAACVCDDTGRVLFAVGTTDVPVFLRSASKPFIAAAAIRAGVAGRFALTPREIAVMAASHSGEPMHTGAVASILEKIGATESDLRCGVQSPQNRDAARALYDSGARPTQLHHNCSGKHAGILALARLRGVPLEGYLEASHPAQAEVLAFCEKMFGETFTPDRLGIDGCGIPVFATSLEHAARTFARFASLTSFEPEDAEALRVVRDAMAAWPEMVAGTDRFDTDLMVATAGAVVSKAGAEGVQSAALVKRAIGLVLKAIDGSQRPLAAATMALLQSFDALDMREGDRLAGYARTPITNVAGRTVGEIRAKPGFAAPAVTKQ